MRKQAVATTAIAVVIAVFLNGRVSMADDTYNTVLGLLTQCRAVEKTESTDFNAANWGLCHGRIEGYFIATETWARPTPFCAPPDTTHKQLVRAFVRWAENNPGRWLEPSYVGLQTALTNAFPCQERQQK